MKGFQMNLKEFIEAARIDWEDASVEPDSGPLDYDCPFNLTPEDFVTFAKADVFNKDTRGLINGLSNAKRAIDCQTDLFITCLGLNPEKLPQQLGAVGLAELKRDELEEIDAPLKFRFLAALGVATPAIISRMRKLRNVLEHEYRQPRRRDVSDAIDVAELFIQACRGRFRSAWQIFSIESGKTDARRLGMQESEIRVDFDFKQKPSARFDVQIVDFRKFRETKKWERKSDVLKPGHKGFVLTLKLLWQSDINQDLRKELASFLTELGVPFPRNRLGRKKL
jgi:hypothetical protein